jgi:alkylation response protein AidB-like acyl-CoA dehydrogenase
MKADDSTHQSLVEKVRRFVEQKIIPVASRLEHKDEYPEEIVEGFKQLGLFGANVSPEYGGLGLDYMTFATIIEELARGWMSVVGPIGTHSVACDVIGRFGTEAQKQEFLPGLAAGERRGGLALTEADAGTDVQRLQTTATRRGDGYLINGSKMWITNGRRGNTFVLAAKTEAQADPPYRGISAFIIEKGGAGFDVVREIDTLGYRGVENCELAFKDFYVPAQNLVGGREGEGFKQIMTGLESERINVAARGVGVARAAFEAAIQYAQKRQTFGKPICEHQAIQFKLADMAIERFYRDAPLLLIGGGTNELQRLIIAARLVEKYNVRETDPP